MAVAIIVRARREGQASRVVTGFPDAESANIWVRAAGLSNQVFRSGLEYKTGDLLLPESVTVAEENKRLSEQDPGWLDRLAEAEEDHVDRKARKAQREAEYQRQRDEQREAERREQAVRDRVEQLRRDAELKQIKKWRAAAEAEYEGSAT